MKKAALLVFAALLVVMFSVPALAMEHQFGGYWRTRFYTNQNFDGNDIENGVGTNDWTAVDTRTRLYYTAVFSENLLFRNEFEFDGTWGSGAGANDDLWRGRIEVPGNEWTDFGADGANFEIKKSYVDFTMGPLNAKVGIQGACLARGFLFCAPDFPGAIVSYQGDGITVPFIWMKLHEGGQSDNALDVDYFGLSPEFSAGKFNINPYFFYGYSDNAREAAVITPDYVYSENTTWVFDPSNTPDDSPIEENTSISQGYEEYNVYWAGIDIDADFGAANIWLTGIYQGGEADFIRPYTHPDSAVNTNYTSHDYEAWLGAIGGSVGFGMGNVHGQFFYASGDDDETDNEQEAFFGIGENGGAGNYNQSYYWAEILGYGIFDAMVPSNSPGDAISNIMAANIGATVRPMDKLSITLDAWWAQKTENIDPDDDTDFNDEIFEDEDELGVEVDLIITYELIENLRLDLVGAYLFAGDAIYNGPNDADPYEIGSRLSLSF